MSRIYLLFRAACFGKIKSTPNRCRREHSFREMQLPQETSLKATDDALLDTACRKVLRRFMPFLIAAYIVCFLDRVNLGFASITMQQDLAMTAKQIGFALGIFSIGYFLFEVPSNLMLHKFGARRWIARIMITWGLVSAATAFVYDATSLNIARVILGIAEAGFVPGIAFFLTLWFPAKWRTKALATFLIAAPVSSVIGSPISGAILGMDGVMGMHGWQWLFILEAAPAIVLGIVCLFILVDRPSQASFLDADERDLLTATLERERAATATSEKASVLQTLLNGRVLSLAAINFFFLCGLVGTAMWMPMILKNFGLKPLEIGLLNALPNALAAIGMIYWARAATKAKSKFNVISLAAGIAAAGFAASAAAGSSALLAYVALAVAIIGIYGFFATYFVLPAEFLSGRAAAVSYAVVISVGNLGGFAGPFAIGWIRDSTQSFTAALLAMAGCLVIVSIAVIVFGRVVSGGSRVPVAGYDVGRAT